MGQFPKLGWGRHSWGHDPQVWVKFPMEPCPWILFFWGGGLMIRFPKLDRGRVPWGHDPQL